MVKFQALVGLLALVSPLVVLADVTPSEPGPGSSFQAGSTCRVTWEGDTASSTDWKDMSIELMSGSNTDMVHITTVATNQDGTKDGSFEWKCPEVDPYSTIYFYQLSSPHTSAKTWTTRFTITSASGDSTPPANSKQPSGDSIPWGVGKLVDASIAVPAPSYLGGGRNSSASDGTLVSSTKTSSSVPTNSKMVVITSSSAPSRSSPSSTSSAGSATSSSGALSTNVMDGGLWMTAFVACVAAFF